MAYTFGKIIMKRRIIIGAIAAGVLIAAFWASAFLIAYTDRGFICENTGSRMGYREWPFGIRTNEWYRESQLERFIKNSHPEVFEHRWTSYSGRGSSLIPGTVMNGHGRPGPILFLRPEMLDEWIKDSSDHERFTLYRAFSSGNKNVCQSGIDEMIEKSIEESEQGAP